MGGSPCDHVHDYGRVLRKISGCNRSLSRTTVGGTGKRTCFFHTVRLFSLMHMCKTIPIMGGILVTTSHRKTGSCGHRDIRAYIGRVLDSLGRTTGLLPAHGR